MRGDSSTCAPSHRTLRLSQRRSSSAQITRRTGITGNYVRRRAPRCVSGDPTTNRRLSIIAHIVGARTASIARPRARECDRRIAGINVECVWSSDAVRGDTDCAGTRHVTRPRSIARRQLPARERPGTAGVPPRAERALSRSGAAMAQPRSSKALSFGRSNLANPSTASTRPLPGRSTSAHYGSKRQSSTRPVASGCAVCRRRGSACRSSRIISDMPGSRRRHTRRPCRFKAHALLLHLAPGVDAS